MSFLFLAMIRRSFFFFFFFNDTATTEIYTLSLHDALPISGVWEHEIRYTTAPGTEWTWPRCWAVGDRKSTRLNSSHGYISYAVFCLKKKKKKRQHNNMIYQSNTSILDIAC